MKVLAKSLHQPLTIPGKDQVQVAPSSSPVSLEAMTKALASVAPKPSVVSTIADANAAKMKDVALAFVAPDANARAFAAKSIDATVAAKIETEARTAAAEERPARAPNELFFKLATRWLPTHLAIADGSDKNLNGKPPEVVAERQRLSRAILAEISTRLVAQIPVDFAIRVMPKVMAAVLQPTTVAAGKELAAKVALAEQKIALETDIRQLKEAIKYGFEVSLGEKQAIQHALAGLEKDPTAARGLIKSTLDRLAPLLVEQPEKKPTTEELAQLRRDIKAGLTANKKYQKGLTHLESLKAEVAGAKEPTRAERFTGAMIGLAIGDALGGPTEFMSREDLRAKHGLVTDMIGGGWLDLQPGEYTDDTQMAEAMAKAIVHAGGFDAAEIQKRWIGWLNTDPKDVGGLTRDALELSRVGVQPELSGQIPWMLSGFENAGNGSVMRSAPVALLTAQKSVDEIESKAMSSSSITHSDPRCTYGTAAIAFGLSQIMAGESDVLGKTIAYLKDREPTLAESLAKVPTMSAEDLRTSGYSVDTVQAAFWALVHAKSYPEGIITVSNLGEDTDTAGATAGILLGAKFGLEGIPESWRTKLQNADGLMKLAKQIQKLNEAE